MADAYNQVATLALDKIAATSNADFAGPAVICRSFAIELLLKFFIVVQYPDATRFSDLRDQGADVQGHVFSALFDRLRDEQRDLIATSYTERTGQATTATRFRKLLVEIGDKPFVEWRYIYESRGDRHLDPVLLDNLVNALGLAAQTEVRRLKVGETTD